MPDPRTTTVRPGGALDPAVIDRLADLSLVARRVVEGFMSGQHRSPFTGSSVEFAQHREYVPGDELRRIDWRVFARSERLVVKEFVEETNLTCYVLLDASESMGFGSQRWNKLDYARWAAAALAHLVLTQRDTAGLVVFDSKHRKEVPSSNGDAQRRTILAAIEDAQAREKSAVGEVLKQLGPQLKRRGIVAVFSDFFDDVTTIVEGLRRLVHRGQEPILFQVLDPQELRFDFEGMLKLQGLEALGDIKVDAKEIRNAYMAEIEAHNRELAQKARSLNLDHVLLDTAQPLDAVLSTYLARRAARARGGAR